MTATQNGAVSIQNLFANAAPPPAGERFDTLLEHKNLVIERISSSSAIAPNQYVQPQDEWVLLVQGTAVIEIDLTLTLFGHMFGEFPMNSTV